MSITVPTQDDSGGLLNFIERASRDPEFDVAKFEALLRMQREIVQEQARVAFNRAMAEAQAEMMPVIRDATNVHTGSKYAKLETIDREMRPIYTKHGFGVRFGSDVAPREGWLRIVCTVSLGGYSETNYLDAPPDTAGMLGKSNKNPLQAVGSSVTYLRRYLLAMVFNIVLADQDDDGEAGGRTSAGGDGDKRPSGEIRKPPDPLDEPNGTLWLKNLLALLAAAETQRAMLDLRTDPRVVKVLESPKTPSLIKGQIVDRFREAFERFAKVPERPNGEDAAGDPVAWDDPIAELLAELDARLDLMALNQLIASAEWHARVRNAASFPPDATRLNEAIAARRAALEGRA
jgi:hypothetical protein